MRLFLKRFIRFIIAFIITIIVVILLNYVIVKTENIKLPKGKHIIILGDSNTECAINDSIFKSSMNFSASSDAYFYSYLKLKTLLKSDIKIDTILLAFSPHNIFDNGWLLDSSHIYSNFRNYYPLMEWEDFKFLYDRNPGGIISAIPPIVQQLGINLYKKVTQKNIILSYGQYLYLERDILEEVQQKLKNGEKLPFFDMPNSFKVSDYEIRYLNKIISMCEKKGIALFLINTPKRHEILNYEKYGVDKFKVLYKSKYSNINYLDFSELELPDNYYGDFVHLNVRGSTYFSDLLNKNKLERFIYNKY